MLNRSLAYFAMQQDPGALPLAAVVLQTDRGVRVWSDRMLTDAETWTPASGTLADGSALANGALLAGAQIMPIIERSARLTDPGTPSEQTLPVDQFNAAPTAYTGRQVGDLTITLDNSDRGPSQALSIETWLSASERDLRIPRPGAARLAGALSRHRAADRIDHRQCAADRAGELDGDCSLAVAGHLQPSAGGGLCQSGVSDRSAALCVRGPEGRIGRPATACNAARSPMW